MLHSIIIPYRARPRRLSLCLERIAKAWAIRPPSGATEILIVNDGAIPLTPVVRNACVRWVEHHRTCAMFNKPSLLNAGIRQSCGDILSFLDVDSLVGDRFFEAAEFALSPRLTKVCYRVRSLAEDALAKAENDPGYIDAQFDVYDTHALRFEARQLPDMDCHVGTPVFGNSQFSIQRDVLGDLRFNESFEGAGFEDIDMNRAIWERHGSAYHATVMDDADHAILDIQNTREPDWFTPEQHAKNGERYRSNCPWNITQDA